MRLSSVVILSLAARAVNAQEPIIDAHMHAVEMAQFVALAQPPPIPHCVPMTDYPVPSSGKEWPAMFKSAKPPCRATWSPVTDDEVRERSLAIMKRRNIYGVVSGSQVARWSAVAPERVIPSLGFPGPDAMSVESMRKEFKEGRFAVLGEVTAQYGGMSPDDPSLEPYWALAEELDIPVGIHIGTGPVGAPYLRFDRYRARLHSPLGLEEVLLRHPGLRVYIMHAGWPMIDDLLAVLWTHPQVHVDLGVIDWALPRAEFHRYLQRIVEAGFGKRVLFGSDQMIWPETIEMAIQNVASARFLTAEQRRDIFFNNAARFFRLSPERIAAMRGKKPN
jgi:predicted TIM-barrel fold metal-dependent hydrolase